MIYTTKQAVLILVLTFISHQAFTQVECPDPATCFGCNEPGALNYDPDANSQGFDYCYFLKPADGTIEICPGQSVQIGGYQGTDIIACVDPNVESLFQVSPSESLSEPFGYSNIWVSPGEFSPIHWLVSPAETTTYELLDFNNEGCEPQVLATYEIIVKEDCNCVDPGNCNDGDYNNGFEYWDPVNCLCESITTDCGCGIDGALNDELYINCSDINLCEFEVYQEGVPVCSDDAVILGPFQFNANCESPTWSFTPPDDVIAVQDYQGAGEGVFHFILSSDITETITYTFTNNFNSSCETVIDEFEVIRIDDESCISGIAQSKAPSVLKIIYSAHSQVSFQLPEAQTEQIDYSILDLSGRVIKQAVSDTPQWQMSFDNLTPGIYLISGTFGTERFWVF